MKEMGENRCLSISRCLGVSGLDVSASGSKCLCLFVEMCACTLRSVQVFVTPWTIDRQAFLSIGFSRQEYWSGLPFPTPGDLPDLGLKPTSLASPALASGFFTNCSTWEALVKMRKRHMCR